MQSIQEALTLARESAHPFSLAFALIVAAYLHQFRREAQAVQKQAEAVIAVSTEQGTLLVVSIVTVLFSMTAVWVKAIATDPIDHNRSVVLRYVNEVLDGKKIDLLDELFTTDV